MLVRYMRVPSINTFGNRYNYYRDHTLVLARDCRSALSKDAERAGDKQRAFYWRKQDRGHGCYL